MTPPKEPEWIRPIDLTLDELFALAAIPGVIAAQPGRPDPRFVAEWALDFGTTMATLAKARRPKP
jgi:hypothetical protein